MDRRTPTNVFRAALRHAGWVALLLLPAAGCSTYRGHGVRYQIDHEYSVGDPQFLRAMGQLVSPGILAGNHVKLHVIAFVQRLEPRSGDQLGQGELGKHRGKYQQATTHNSWKDIGDDHAPEDGPDVRSQALGGFRQVANVDRLDRIGDRPVHEWHGKDDGRTH